MPTLAPHMHACVHSWPPRPCPPALFTLTSDIRSREKTARAGRAEKTALCQAGHAWPHAADFPTAGPNAVQHSAGHGACPHLCPSPSGLACPAKSSHAASLHVRIYTGGTRAQGAHWLFFFYDAAQLFWPEECGTRFRCRLGALQAWEFFRLLVHTQDEASKRPAMATRHADSEIWLTRSSAAGGRAPSRR